MAPLPDPTSTLRGDDLATYRQMDAARGEGALGQVYVRMFNNPTVAKLVGDLGAHLRFHGVLPGDTREIVILHLARRLEVAYEWVHHLAPADRAGVPHDVIAALDAGTPPPGLRPEQTAALAAADAVIELRSIPEAPQHELIAAHGVEAIVELAALVGLYRLIAGMITAFDIPIEPAFEVDRPAWHPA
jgi:4-carboxymuconolactone decarboxylase